MPNGENHNGWRAQLLRVTIFTLGALPAIDGLWHRITGKEPEIDERRRSEGVHRQLGPHGNGQFEIRSSLGRADLLMTPPATTGTEPSLHFGPFESEVSEFLKLVCPWLADPGCDVIRIAFAGVLVYPATDRAETYELLARYVPSLKVDAEGSKEVQYRVNRPITSKSGIDFNRITTWNSIITQMLAGTSPTSLLNISEQHFLRLEFDHNTLAERTDPLESAELVPIFEELVALAIENASKGECPS